MKCKECDIHYQSSKYCPKCGKIGVVVRLVSANRLIDKNKKEKLYSERQIFNNDQKERIRDSGIN